MKRSQVVFVAVVAACAFGAGAFAQDVVTWIGAAASHRSFERYDMSIGVTAGQQLRRPVRIDEERSVFNVPSHYGTLVGMTGGEHSTVFWYRDADGAMRNVVLAEPASRSYKVQQMATTRYEADIREQ